MNPDPNFNLFFKEATEHHRAGRLSEAVRRYEFLIAKEPANTQVLHLAGVACTQMKDYPRAISFLKRCSTLEPKSAEVANNLGLALFGSGRAREAIARFEHALALDPALAKAANNLGNAYCKAYELEPARRAFEKALEAKPDYLEARTNLGQCLLMSGDAKEALEQYEVVLGRNPKHRPALEGLIAAHQLIEYPDRVVALRRKLLEKKPHEPLLWLNLGLALQAIDRHAEAIDCYRKALELEPRYAAAHARTGSALMEMGQFEEARSSFQKACALAPDICEFRYLAANATKVAPGDETIAALDAMLARKEQLTPTQQVFLHFGLAKTKADAGDEESAFRYRVEGKRIARTLDFYDESAAVRSIDRTIELFSAEMLSAWQGAGNPSEAPVFILGMPRSGSTLVEQVLSAHPAVLSLGEMTAFRDMILAASQVKGSVFPEWLPSLTGDDVAALGANYVRQMNHLANVKHPNADPAKIRRLTDKMPGNYLYLGLIHLALPNARFIHTRRNPIETCLSCFRINFENLPYTNDMGELGRYYRRYASLMEFWKATLPDGPVLEVDYETLVDDFEAQARRIVSHCGLEWDPACLSFQDVKRPVRTSSIKQVRQPLYRTSLRTWRPSQEQLRPLLEGLGTLAADR
jgi:tetratricopeptide (TPR) repeat protein